MSKQRCTPPAEFHTEAVICIAFISFCVTMTNLVLALGRSEIATADHICLVIVTRITSFDWINSRMVFVSPRHLIHRRVFIVDQKCIATGDYIRVTSAVFNKHTFIDCSKRSFSANQVR